MRADGHSERAPTERAGPETAIAKRETGSPRWERRRLFHLDWAEFGAGAEELAVRVAASGFQPDVILGLARGGLPLATVLGHRLSGHVETVAVTRNSSDDRYPARAPVAISRSPLGSLADARVLIADDIAGDGGTLAAAREMVTRVGAAEARAAVLAVNDGCAVVPEYFLWSVDDWVIFPWERQVDRRENTEPLTLKVAIQHGSQQ